VVNRAGRDEKKGERSSFIWQKGSTERGTGGFFQFLKKRNKQKRNKKNKQTNSKSRSGV